MPNIRACVKSTLFMYETPKLVLIESRLIGVLHRLLQLALLGLVVVWIFILNRGYQHVDNGAVGGSTTKLKGVAYSNLSDERVGERVWDSVDLHIPPQDNGAFFLTTNVIVTRGQVQSVCADVEYTTRCKNDSQCLPLGEPYHLGHGLSTGVCNVSTGQCMVESWCPVENDSLPEGGMSAALKHTKNFTVLIKNHVYFPYYKKGRSNLIEGITKTKLRNCNYHPVDDPHCPIFRLGTIIGMAGRQSSLPNRTKDDEEFDEMAIEGGVVSITIKWDCDFDYHESECKPEYAFARLDIYQSQVASSGYNFRYPLYYVEDGIQKRQLVKAYGILFIISTEATARAFNLKTFLLNVGSGLALLGIASIFSDVLLLHIHKNRTYFKRFKMDPIVTIRQRKSDMSHILCDNSTECSEPMTSSNNSSNESHNFPPSLRNTSPIAMNGRRGTAQ